jgi:hypothetical protein
MSTVTTIAEQKLNVLKAIDELVDFMNARTAEVWASEYTKPYTFSLEGSGRKYLRISMSYGDSSGGSVHCFVDALTGDVYKAASWKTPALNGARFNILNADSLDLLKESFDWAGSYLYKR